MTSTDVLFGSHNVAVTHSAGRRGDAGCAGRHVAGKISADAALAQPFAAAEHKAV